MPQPQQRISHLVLQHKLDLGRKRNPFCKASIMKTSNLSVTSVAAPNPALIAFFIEANRLADVARERATLRENTSAFAEVVDVILPLTLSSSKHLGEHHSHSTWSVAVAQESLSSGSSIIKTKSLLPRNLMVMQFNSRPLSPRQKLTFRVGE